MCHYRISKSISIMKDSDFLHEMSTLGRLFCLYCDSICYIKRPMRSNTQIVVSCTPNKSLQRVDSVGLVY